MAISSDQLSHTATPSTGGAGALAALELLVLGAELQVGLAALARNVLERMVDVGVLLGLVAGAREVGDVDGCISCTCTPAFSNVRAPQYKYPAGRLTKTAVRVGHRPAYG